MDAPIVRGLNDKLYDRRKAAALELEKVIQQSDSAKISTIINQLCQMFTSPSSPLHTRNGGLIGLAATAIALGMDFSSWLGVVVPRVLGCFGDGESRVRYYACESLYNIAKVCKGEILVHFNGIFDALSKLSADSEASVKNGAELLDRLLKDIVSETALNYVSQYPENVDRTFGWVEMEHPSIGHGGLGEWGYQGRLRASLAAEREKDRKHPLEESPDLKPVVFKDPPAINGSVERDGLAPGRSLPKSDGSITRDPSPHSVGVGAGASGIVTKDGSARTMSISGSSGHVRRQSQSQAPATAGIAHHSGTSTLNMGLHAPQTAPAHRGSHSTDVSPHPSIHSPSALDQDPQPRLAFSLAKFIPLLSERIYVISPFTRSHLVSWIMVLDSVPDLELVSYLPEFLDGLLKYLSDPSPDVKIATEAVLKDFLHEIRHIAHVQRRQLESGHTSNRSQTTQQQEFSRRTSAVLRRRASKLTMETENSELDSIITGTNTMDGDGNVGHMSPEAARMDELKEEETDAEHEDSSLVHDPDEIQEYDDEEKGTEHAAWIPGQGVFVDHEAIMDIMIQHVAYPDDQISSQALRWISSFLTFVQDVMIGFTPRLIPAVLPNLAHHAPSIQSAASETNQLLYHAIQALPSPSSAPPQMVTAAGAVPGPSPSIGSHSVVVGQSTGSQSTIGHEKNPSPNNRKDIAATDSSTDGNTLAIATDGSDTLRPSFSAISLGTAANTLKTKAGVATEPSTPINFDFPYKPRPGSPSTLPPTTQGGSAVAQQTVQPVQPSQATVPSTHPTFDDDLFDIRETVNQLTLQFLSEHEETRVASLEWLLMLHQKAPKRILARDDGTFPVLLKTLSDPSEEVVKHDLQLLAQISATSEDSYFSSFLVNLLELFSTDRRLLETRGSLIIRQLCLNMNTERIFRTFAEVLEREEDLEFASLMVVKLNMILITSPELADFRKRLKNLESKDGQMLFTAIYKSWCHNAVAVFALCLLAQAYEHASNLLQTFAELEMTVPLLVQIDKLVMLIESPVFTALRLQLLEPERYPFLFKCLYGLLMLLPQSSAFVSLRNRLSAVSSMGFLHIPKASYTPSVAASRSKLSSRDEIKWQELLGHFRQVQNKHEKARRQSQAGEAGHGHSMSGFHFSGPSTSNSPSATGTGRRRTAGSGSRKESGNSITSVRAHPQSTLSPLNPRRGGSRSASGSLSALALGAPFGTTMTNGQRSKSPTLIASTRRKILPGLRR